MLILARLARSRVGQPTAGKTGVEIAAEIAYFSDRGRGKKMRCIRVSEASLYTILKTMRRDGLVSNVDGSKRYTITPTGRDEFVRRWREWERFIRMVDWAVRHPRSAALTSLLQPGKKGT